MSAVEARFAADISGVTSTLSQLGGALVAALAAYSATRPRAPIVEPTAGTAATRSRNRLTLAGRGIAGGEEKATFRSG